MYSQPRFDIAVALWARQVTKVMLSFDRIMTSIRGVSWCQNCPKYRLATTDVAHNVMYILLQRIDWNMQVRLHRWRLLVCILIAVQTRTTMTTTTTLSPIKRAFRLRCVYARNNDYYYNMALRNASDSPQDRFAAIKLINNLPLYIEARTYNV